MLYKKGSLPVKETTYIYKTKISNKLDIKNAFIIMLKDKLLHFTFLSLLIKSVIFLSIINSQTISSINLTKAFYGKPPILLYFGFIYVFLSFSYLFKDKYQNIYLIIINIVISFLFILDLMHYRGFNTFLSLHLLKETSNLDNLGSDIISMIRTIDIIFLVDIPLFICICIWKRNIFAKKSRNVFLSISMFALSILVIFSQYIWYDKLGLGPKYQVLFKICWAPYQTMSNLSPLGYHFYDNYKFLEDLKPYKLSNREKLDIKSWFSNKKENLPDNKYHAMFKGKNLIILQVESLENFVINRKINNQEITPNINSLLNHAIYFSNYHEQVNNGTTSDAELMTNTSIYPIRSGSTFFRFASNTYPNSLPMLFRNMGYTTLAIDPDKSGYWNWVAALTSFGFQRCIDYSSFNHDEFIGLGLSDGTYLKQSVRFIEKQKQPFYTFMITLSSHSPFNLPNQYRKLELDSKLDKTYLGGYFQSVHYTDEQIGKYVETLDKDGILDNTVLVICGDHCGVHKYYQDQVNKIEPSEDWWKDNHMQIPLVIYNKSLEGEKIDINGGQIDLLPTISYLMGINPDKYENTAMGRNLLNTKKDFAVLANGKFVSKSDNPHEEQNDIKGIDIADKIIRSNYFKYNK